MNHDHPIQSYIPQCPRKDGMISEDGVYDNLKTKLWVGAYQQPCTMKHNQAVRHWANNLLAYKASPLLIMWSAGTSTIPSPNLATDQDNRFLRRVCAESITSFPIWKSSYDTTYQIGFYFHNPSGWRN